MYGRQAKPPNTRLKRWLLRIQQCSFKIKYITGWWNLADGLNRLPIYGTEIEYGVGVEEYAYPVMMESVSAAMTATQIELESAGVPLSIQIRDDTWANLKHTMFKAACEE